MATPQNIPESNDAGSGSKIGELIRYLRIRNGFAQSELAEKLDINSSYISRIEKGDRRPSPKLLVKLATTLQYPYKNLAIAAGILDESVELAADTVPSPGSIPLLNEIVKTLNKSKPGASLQKPTSKEIPVFDSVPAGLLKESNIVEAYADVEKIVITEEELNFDPQAFALIVSGDSMIEAGILDGDVLIISPSTRVKDGDIGVVQINSELTCVKRIFFEGDSMILQPANSRYKPMIVKYPAEVEILGKVILVRRKIY